MAQAVTALRRARASRSVRIVSRRAPSIWAAGVMASPAALWLGADSRPRRPRRRSLPDLSVAGHPDIFVIGDTALAAGDGRQAAARRGAGRQAAGPLRRAASDRRAKAAKRHRRSIIATSARSRPSGANARSCRWAACKLKGFIAWLLWSVAHIYFLIGFRNRFVVAINWLWNYITFQRGTRLITGVSGARMDDMPTPEQDAKPPLRGAA